MDKNSLDKSSYSWHFNTLTYLGAWVLESSNPKKANAYIIYKILMSTFAIIGCFSLFFDLYDVYGDFKKMTWNLCISTLFAGSLIKNIYTTRKCDIINGLRMKLHENSTTKKSPQDDIVNKLSARELKIVRIFFYGSVSIFIPLWLITLYLSYLWGPKKIPVPLSLPFTFDYDDDFQYNSVFLSVAFAGCVGIALVLETEMSMFTILIQISREYKRFLYYLNKINELYEENEKEKNSSKEVNPYLRNVRAKKLIKDYCVLQQQLIQYTEDFEFCYSRTMVLQIFVLTVLVIVSAMQCILEYGRISANIAYQLGYICIIVMDMFLVCWFATRIRDQCLRVGEKAYAMLWYRMDMDIQKDVYMIILRSQNPPKITSGKLMELNLHAFMLVVRNIYSWLALFQQLAFKTKE